MITRIVTKTQEQQQEFDEIKQKRSAGPNQENYMATGVYKAQN